MMYGDFRMPQNDSESMVLSEGSGTPARSSAVATDRASRVKFSGLEREEEGSGRKDSTGA